MRDGQSLGPALENRVTRISREVHLVERPTGIPKKEHFRVVQTVQAEAGAGEVLVQNLYMSVDPAMRPRLAGQTPLNAPLEGGAIGRIVQSNHPAFSEGDPVRSVCGFREYFVSDGDNLTLIEPDGLPLPAYLSVLGTSGLTAYGGLLAIAGLQDGENVFVSAAAGAVGSVAAQIAKLKRCFVIGSAGSDEKCAWLRNELRVDVAINYKKQKLRHALKESAPKGIDVYFENVGGEHLNAALPRMNPLGRIPVCGMIAAYNNFGSSSEPVTTLSNLIYNRITMRGFVVSEFESLRPQFLADMKGWLREGRIKYRETILEGIEQAPAALIGLFSGLNTGKMLVRLAAE
jgi:NADPH-dependent curcumin reductase CurA